MSRSGFASLLALVTLVVATTVIAGMLATARSTALTGIVVERTLASETLLDDGERLACTWLDRHGPQVVFPSSGGGLLLSDRTWQDHAGRSCRLAIVLVDTLACLPPAALTAGHPLRLALVSPGAAPRLSVDPTTIPPADLLAQVRLASDWGRFPTAIPADRPVGSILDPLAFGPQPLLALWFSPDNPGAINLNTAPAALVRAAVEQDTDGEEILALRRAAKRWAGNPRAGQGGVQLVATSNRWSILLVATIAGRSQVRWSVGDGVGGNTQIIRRADVTASPASAPDP